MAKAAQAALLAQVVVFGFDPDPATAANRALNVLTVKGGLPTIEVEKNEKVEAAALRAVSEAGLDLGRRRSLTLVGLHDEPGNNRTVTPWFATSAAFGELSGSGRWSPVGRGLRLDAGSSQALKVATERLRSDTRHVAGAAAVLGDVFTGDDLLRLHVALHGGPRSSERTFRRRVQELRDSGVLRPVKDSEVAALRLRVPRFRSPAGTGGRPPELLRYSGSGGEEEQLAGLRARRSA